MISRAIAAGVPFAWFTADETYGQAKYLQAWLESRDVSYVMAIRCSDTLTMPAGEQRADALIAAAPARRSLSDRVEIAYYACYGAPPVQHRGPGLDRGKPLAR